MRPQVNDPAEFLHATIARVALGRDAELPAHVVVFAEPVGVVEGRVGEELSFAARKSRQVAAQSRFAFPRSAAVVSFSEGAIQIMALARNVFQKVSSVNKNEFPPASGPVE